MFKRTALTRTLFFMAADVLLVVLAVWLSFILRFDGTVPPEFVSALEITTVLAVVFLVPIFYFFGLYSFSWSYISTRELVSLIFGSTFSFLFLGTAIFLSRDFASFEGFPRSTLFVSYILAVFFTAGIRFSKKVYIQFLRKGNFSANRERVLIVGAGDAGEQLARSMQSTGHYQPVGFVDDSPVKKGSYIHGIKVLGSVENIPEIVLQNKIESIIVAFPSARTEVVKKAVEMGRKAGVSKIKILPPLSEIVDGQVSLSDIRDFKMEDLLQRYPVISDHKPDENFLKDKVVLVAGAAGSIGSELCRQIAKLNPSLLLLLDQDETGIFNIQKEIKENFLKALPIIADIQDKAKIRKIFEKFKPDVVFHAAAYKHVPLMEQEPEEAVKNNIIGTEIVAKSALDFNAEKFIFISTDKAVNPVSVMGATKRIGEMICQTLNRRGSTEFVSVRFGNVLGSRGSVIPVFKEQIKKGGPVVVTHEDMKRYFMIIPEAASLVLQASQIGRGGEVLVLNMGNPVRIMDLAKEVIKLSGLDPDKDIPIVVTKPRPGEKLFEEIMTSQEGATATSNKNIFSAKLSDVDEADFNNILEKLTVAAGKSDRETIINILKNIK
jgi:FlaA1/EpsC-like NDP-sugar epimerase